MKQKRSPHPGWWALILVSLIIGSIPLTVMAFKREFTSYAKVTLVSDRSGLVMDANAVVKYRGVEVGRVASIEPKNGATLQLELYPGQLKYIPANVEAQISSPTVFGAKYVDLRPPSEPSRKRLASGTVLTTRKVSIEANTILKDLVGVLNEIDTAKINAVLSALAEGFRGKGEAIGQAITDFNQVLTAVNPRSELLRADWRAFGGFSDAYGAAAQNLVTVLDAGGTDASLITKHAKDLDWALVALVGLGNSGNKLIVPNKGNLVHLLNVLEPTTRLLMKYNPNSPARFSAPSFLWTGAMPMPSRSMDDRSSPMPAYCSATTHTSIRTTCRSLTSRAAPAGRPAAVRCPTWKRTSRSDTWSPTPGSEMAWTCGPTQVSGSRVMPTMRRSPGEHRNRRP